jgi:hypothetical protein
MRRWLALIWLAGLATGCVGTRAWQRETLARPEMAVDEPLGGELEAHVLGSREGAVGGMGGGGGGCGCN